MDCGSTARHHIMEVLCMCSSAIKIAGGFAGFNAIPVDHLPLGDEDRIGTFVDTVSSIARFNVHYAAVALVAYVSCELIAPCACYGVVAVCYIALFHCSGTAYRPRSFEHARGANADPAIASS
jgi:hypothetical protein